ncbi:bifunctional 4-hydroxy-2-oxoglutarate aldolase/2-dehydro-3-deoxy-phosphogluconate aldolase [Streptomyces sp. J2-1]|uniref:bifunctional 4-hydroxy-2-oxoglutarate aldolase/2-dehydro-3-deoxy-phosphogluconate aldolase n=1 Tax=Streptomyces corallincola TaxID=2851888 RepID=UPI001C39265D|nr:bifunctional 4-hydroxy-2-oxoglutarate aldolase/2-dehydro-3-deoxy-phosphogluconate aldolase [Streptomyces corallincola]MBV2354091.1 bifunctional 4-hydroxy-2-oxoglutarate aldolase/2-dehydro-3-deoxy-phosphogluconate aldolase [Streptomyces corallincola]
MDLRAALADRRLVAIVRGGDPDAALRTVLTLAEEGIDLIEVSLSGADALGVITRATKELGPGRPIGAGTVLTADDARAALDAGAAFAVTPGLGAGSNTARDLGLPVLAGVMTPTEIIAARARGADALKLFPAADAGGPAYLKALRAPFPDAVFVPVGGVDLAAARAYLAAGATAVGVGSPLVADAADGGSRTALRERARAFRAAAEEATA